jgi:hypothetical protein
VVVIISSTMRKDLGAAATLTKSTSLDSPWWYPSCTSAAVKRQVQGHAMAHSSEERSGGAVKCH